MPCLRPAGHAGRARERSNTTEGRRTRPALPGATVLFPRLLPVADHQRRQAARLSELPAAVVRSQEIAHDRVYGVAAERGTRTRYCVGAEENPVRPPQALLAQAR